MNASSLSYACLSMIFLLSPGVPSIAHAQAAQPPLSLQLPLACQPNLNCWIAKYMDDDPGPETLDYACGKRTSDGHKGTDFAIEDRRVMTEGVSVVAAAEVPWPGCAMASQTPRLRQRLGQASKELNVGTESYCDMVMIGKHNIVICDRAASPSASAIGSPPARNLDWWVCRA